MKILAIGYNSVNNGQASSGRERLLIDVSKKLIKNNCEVKVFFKRAKGKNENFIKSFSLIYRVIDIILNQSCRFFKFPDYKRRYHSENLFDFFIERELKNKYDLIITTNPWIPKTSTKARLNDVKLILLSGNPSDNLIYNLIKKEKRKIGLEKYFDSFDSIDRLNKYNIFAKNVNEVITINKFTAQTFQDDKFFSNSIFFNVEISQLVNHKPLNTKEEIINVCNNSLNVFYLAYTSTLKGLHYLIESILKANELGFKTKLWIGGNIEHHFFEFLQKKFPNLKNNFVFLGNLDSKRKNWYYKNCDIFICPSLIDMSPVTVFEAMSNHKPVILTSNCGNKWIVENYVNGFVIDPFDSKFIISKLKWCYENKNKLPLMGENAFKSYEKSLEKNTSEIAKIITHIKQ